MAAEEEDLEKTRYQDFENTSNSYSWQQQQEERRREEDERRWRESSSQ
jgi:hypothetical protein